MYINACGKEAREARKGGIQMVENDLNKISVTKCWKKVLNRNEW